MSVEIIMKLLNNDSATFLFEEYLMSRPKKYNKKSPTIKTELS